MIRKKRIVILMIILIFFSFFIFLKFRSQNKVIGLFATKWDNFYNNKNINFYYKNFEKSILKDILTRYKVKEMYNKSADELNKNLEIMNWIKSNLKYNKKQGNSINNKGVLDILGSMDKNKSYSNIEICKIYNEFCISIGMVSRIGKFENISYSSSLKNKEFYVCEVWNNKFKKWIMFDPSNYVYIVKNKVPLSAIEVIKNGLNNVGIIGSKDYKKYISNLKKYCDSYSIPLDNTIYSIKKSNSYVKFLKNRKIDTISIETSIKDPTIFTLNEDLFKIEPNNNMAFKSNEIPTMIFSKDTSKIINKGKNKNKDIKLKLWMGVFKDSLMIDRYYISINNHTFKVQNQYSNIEIKEGRNNIRLSLDGKSVLREIEFKYI